MVGPIWLLGTTRGTSKQAIEDDLRPTQPPDPTPGTPNLVDVDGTTNSCLPLAVPILYRVFRFCIALSYSLRHVHPFITIHYTILACAVQRLLRLCRLVTQSLLETLPDFPIDKTLDTVYSRTA